MQQQVLEKELVNHGFTSTSIQEQTMIDAEQQTAAQQERQLMLQQDNYRSPNTEQIGHSSICCRAWQNFRAK